MVNKELHLIGDEIFEIRRTDKEFNIKNDEILVKVLACGVCGSDFSYVVLNRHSKENSIILGHEISGTVLKVGKDVKKFVEGNRVIVNPGLNCGECEHCKKGNPNLCGYTKFYGYPPFNGGFQKYIVLPEKVCHIIPENIDSVTAVMVEPLAVCLHALNLSKFKHGMDALIIGAGAIGLTLLKLLKGYSSGKIIISEPNSYRRDMAKEFGADIVINPNEENLEEIVKKHTNGIGVDRVFESSGAENIMPTIIKIAKIGAQIVLIGIPKEDIVMFSHSEARKKGLTIKMERTINNTIPQAIDILSRDFEYRKFINFTSSLENMVNNFSDMKRYITNTIKNVVILD